ncbi:hypothetical protein [Pallidibacillus pasinlerensis]|uniref:Yip1 domain-containing protein n=1 Tax=Pallidibacillus pasinlerensis TaxID=2703818 RepID=A0ABX0A983_9BACI|nr:hypothetical protein [Pallidibacillus pasinlerensis]NCU19074.1 hypothetical protein [Pallidibacillus pasinlerensis]
MNKENRNKYTFKKIVKSYTFKQIGSLLLLILLAFGVDYYFRKLIGYIDNIVIKQIILFIGVSIILFVCNLLIYNYAKKKEQFMQHEDWDKMPSIVSVWLMFSLIVLIALYFATPVGNFIATYTWIFNVIAYYFLFFINMMILSFIHLIVKPSLSIVKKLLITWASSSVLVALPLLVLQSF